MPDRASTPTQPRSTASATTSSHRSPAATVTVTPEQDGPAPGSSSVTRPRVATLTTVPGKPASATTRLLPPARTRTGWPASSAAVTASIHSRAGPPRRREVCDRRSSATHDCLGHAEHLLAAAGDGEGDGGEPVLARLG